MMAWISTIRTGAGWQASVSRPDLLALDGGLFQSLTQAHQAGDRLRSLMNLDTALTGLPLLDTAGTEPDRHRPGTRLRSLLDSDQATAVLSGLTLTIDQTADDAGLNHMVAWTVPDPAIQVPVRLNGLTIHQTEQQAGLTGQAGRSWTVSEAYRHRAGRAGLNYQPDISTAWWSGWNDGHLMAGLKYPDDNPNLSRTAVPNSLLETDVGKETDNQVLSITRQDRKETKK